MARRKKFSKNTNGINKGKEFDKTSKQDTEASSEMTKEDVKTNDPEWYSKDPSLIQAAANIPFSDPFGAQLKLDGSVKVDLTSSIKVEFNPSDRDTVPGISVITLHHTYGNSVNRNSPLNVAAQALYTHVRYNNSGRKNYEQSDLMMYMITMSEIYSYIFYLQRIYNCAFTFSQRNKYIGKALLEAQGINATDIANNLANFRYWINMFINKVSSYVVPSSMEIFKRRAFQYSNIYIDNADGNIKDQLYIFKPYGFNIFEYDSDGRPQLSTKELKGYGGSPLTLSDLRAYGDAMLENIYGDEDWGLMSGDLLRSFSGNLLGLASIPEEGGIVPLYDTHVLHQIKNATIVPLHTESEWKYKVKVALGSDTTRDVPYNVIAQDGLGNLVARYATDLANTKTGGAQLVYFNPAAATNCVLLSVDTPLPDPALVIESTRLVTTGTAMINKNLVLGGSHVGMELDVGSDVVVRVTVYKMVGSVDSSKAILTAESFDNAYLNPTGVTGIGTSVADALREYVCFHHNPMIYLCAPADASDTRCGPIYPACDVNNYTVQSKDVFQRLNEVALLSLFYVPGVSKILS